MFKHDGVTQTHCAFILDTIERQVKNLQCVVLFQESSQLSCTVPRYSVAVRVKMHKFGLDFSVHVIDTPLDSVSIFTTHKQPLLTSVKKSNVTEY